jgi:lipoprotein Spr
VNAQGNLSALCLPLSKSNNELEVSKLDSFFRTHSIDLNECSNTELYIEIYRWYKTCYHYGGNSGKGIDCSHFVNMLYEKIYGIKLNGSSASMVSQCKLLKGGISKAKEGDLLFFKIKKKKVSHVGLYLQNGLFVHASTRSGVIISDLKEPYYQKHFYKAGRLE